MSGASTPQPAGQQPKQMSDRLLTMKFMQRAAQNSPAQSTPTRSPPSSIPYETSTKRQKIGNSLPSTPGEPSSQEPKEFANRVAVAAALRAEANARDALRANILREGGETEWVLNLNLPVTNGVNGDLHQDLNEEEASHWSSRSIGRQTYGAFKRRKTTINPVTGIASTPTATQSSFNENDADLSPTPNSEDEEGEISSSPGIQSISKGSKSRSSPRNSASTSGTNTPRTISIGKRKHRQYDEDVDDRAAGRRLDNMKMSQMISLSGSGGGDGFGGRGPTEYSKAFSNKKGKKRKSH